MSDLTVDTITHALLAGDRVMLGRAFTLAESARREDRLLTEQVLQNLLPHTGRSIRIGITGVP
ncbi:MAG: methylmalonyl Co-A mutase-associated GTPase MeaB, partial [Cyclobacteriaceae bacterium]